MPPVENLPIKRVTVDPNAADEQIFAIGLVVNPAIESAWQTYAQDTEAPKDGDLYISADGLRIYSKPKSVFKVKEATERILLGAAMIPNKLILRRDEKTGEKYWLYFTQEAINTLYQRYVRSGYKNAFNFNHNSAVKINARATGVYMKNDHDVANIAGLDIPSGSVFMTVYVEDENAWRDYVATGIATGFSIEVVHGEEDVTSGSQAPADGQPYAAQATGDETELLEAIQTIASIAKFGAANRLLENMKLLAQQTEFQAFRNKLKRHMAKLSPKFQTLHMAKLNDPEKGLTYFLENRTLLERELNSISK